jgi:hypothetical protein
MITYSDYSKIKVNGLFYPLLPYNFESNLIATERVIRDPLGFTDNAETQGKYKTLFNPYNSENITYQSLIYEKLQVKIYASEVLQAVLLKSGQPIVLVSDTGQELLCKVQNVAAEKQSSTTFLLYTIDLIVYENDLINILHPYNSVNAYNSVTQANKITLQADAVKWAGYFDDSVVTLTGHTFTIDFAELATAIPSSVNVSSYDKRNHEGNGVAAVISDITGSILTIDVTHTPGDFYPSSFEFEFDVSVDLDYFTLIQPVDKIIRAENDKIQIEGATIPGKQSTFRAKEIVLFLSDSQRDMFMQYYDNSLLTLTLSTDLQFTGLWNPEANLIQDDSLIDCNPIILQIPYTNIVY